MDGDARSDLETGMEKAMRIPHFVLAGLMVVVLAGTASADTIKASSLPEGAEIVSVLFVVGEVDLYWINGAWQRVEVDTLGFEELLESNGLTPPSGEGGLPVVSSEAPGETGPLAVSAEETSTRVPEPSAWLLLATGLAGLALVARRRPATAPLG
jgi:hypothetical protein